VQAVLVDSCVLLDIFEDDPRWFEWSVSQLEQCARTHALLINSIIYSEISIGFERIEELERQIQALGLKLQAQPKESLFLAGKAFVDYRRRGGQRRSPLPDFFIGAHAAVAGWPLVTRDPRRFSTYFPSVKLIHPQEE